MRAPSATRSRTGGPHGPFVGVPFGRELEGEGDRVLGLVEIGDVEDEGDGASGVDESQAGAGADTDDGGVTDAVEAAVAGRQQPVDVVSGGERLTGACTRDRSRGHRYVPTRAGRSS